MGGKFSVYIIYKKNYPQGLANLKEQNYEARIINKTYDKKIQL